VFLIHVFASSNLHRLRDFIKHVYVDRKYTGEKTGIVELPALRLVSSALLYMQAMDHILILKFHFCAVESLSNNDLLIPLTLAISTILGLINLDMMDNWKY
jgi:hypothetical protein